MKYKIVVVLCFSVLLVTKVFAKVGEVSITILPGGHVMIPVSFVENLEPQFVLLDVNGSNLLRTDNPEKLKAFPIVKSQTKVIFNDFKVGEYVFKNPVTFNLDGNLNKRDDIELPQNCIGTIGFAAFRSNAILLNLKEKKMYFADSFEELAFTEDVKIVVLTSSFMNNVPVVKVKTQKYGVQKMYIDPAQPFAFQFSWQNVPTDLKKKMINELPTSTLKLTGNDSITVHVEKPMAIYLEEDVKVEGYSPVISEKVESYIGAEYLKNYALIIDFVNGIICLDPLTNKAKKETEETSQD